MQKEKIKVAIGMSGGVDSSVAAKILKDQGYDVVGFMMKLWPGSENKCSRDNACCDIDGLQDAKRIAAILDIPFYVVDVREKFKKEVADYFIEEYKNLRTPNPCVKCNEKIKFGWLLDFAKKTGCDYLATGHYARIADDSDSCQLSVVSCQKNSDTIFHLLKGKDEKKDQTYFLYRLTQDQLKHVIFPVGEYSKEEVRAMAKKWNLPVHEKKESQEICFIQDKDYREFLKRHIPKTYFKPGDIVDTKGNLIGKHNGLINYTVGQRKGIEQTKSLQISNLKSQVSIKNVISSDIPTCREESRNLTNGRSLCYGRDDKEEDRDDRCADKYDDNNKKPLYVVGFDLEKNQLVVGEDKDIYRGSMILENLSWIAKGNEERALNSNELRVKIRYRHPAVKISNIQYQISNETQNSGSQKNGMLKQDADPASSAGRLASVQHDSRIEVVFDDPQRAITPGQSAVFYIGEEVLGGGIIL